jgi:pimeloyl-ACP methyl ester carboxylesterase
MHGLTANHHLFDPQVERFEHTFNLIAWDAPLHGGSRPYEDFSYANAAADALSIMDACGVGRCILVGQSMGGYMAQHVIVRAPERVGGFFGIDTAPISPDYYKASDLFWLRQVGWMSMLYPDGALRRGIAHTAAATQSGYENMLSMLACFPTKRELAHVENLGYKALVAELTDMRIDCPAQLVLGERDAIGKMQAYNHAWSERAGLPLAVIPGAGHNSNYDAPDAVDDLLEAFVERCG